MSTASLYNPVYAALSGADRHLGSGDGRVFYFDESVSPFAGFAEGDADGFALLHQALPTDRTILYARPDPIKVPAGWALKHHIEGVQMIFDNTLPPLPETIAPQVLSSEHIPEMLALTALTKPGPFGTGTIRFGHYYGIFVEGQLAAMTGQRLHIPPYSEVSAVCTHPGHLGKGYASALVQHQVNLIRSQESIPFLHVRADNQRAIDVYQRIGFSISRPMQFYFMKRV